MSREASRWRRLVEANHGSLAGWRRHVGARTAYLAGALDRFTRVEPSRVRRLVFVCLGNINRSPFAEGVARRAGLHTASVGLKTATGAPASELAIRLAGGYGVDLSDHAATDFTDHEPEPGDLVLVPETRHIARLIERGTPPEAIALLGAWASPMRIHLEDPNRLSEAWHRSCFALIHSAVVRLGDELAQAGSPCARQRRP
jgi:protein-tyrosine phosphatase